MKELTILEKIADFITGNTITILRKHFFELHKITSDLRCNIEDLRNELIEKEELIKKIKESKNIKQVKDILRNYEGI